MPAPVPALHPVSAARAAALAVGAAMATFALAALLAFGGSLLDGDTAPLLAAMDFNGALFEDLLGPYWRTAEALAAGSTVPDPQYLYPATLAVLLAPLAAAGASASWVAVALGLGSVAALAAAALLLAPARSAPGALGLGVLLGICYPVLHGVHWANAGLPCLALGALGWAAAARGAERTGGALVGLAVAVKLTPAVLVLGLLLGGRRRAAGWAAACAALLGLALPLAVLAPAGFAEFHRAAHAQLRELQALTLTAGGGVGAQDLFAVALRGPLPGLAAGWAGAVVLVGLFQWRGLPAVRARDATGLPWLLAVASLLVHPTWAHGLGWLPLAWWAAIGGGGGAARAAALLSLAAGSVAAAWAFPTPTAALTAALPFTSAALAVLALALTAPSAGASAEGPDRSR